MAFTKVTGPGIHTLSNIISHNIDSSGIITATKFVGAVEGPITGDLVTNDWVTHEGNTTTRIGFPDTNKVEIQANSKIALHVDTAGIVGINTNSPSAAHLDIATTTGTYDNLRLRRTSSGVGDSNWSLKPYAGHLYFRQGGSTDKIVFESGGKIGLNTMTVDDTLHIHQLNANHGIKLERGGATNPGSTTIQVHSHGALSVTSSNNITHTSGGSQQHVWMQGSNEAMRIDENRRLGIGTDNPESLLHLYSASSPAIRLQDTTYDCKTLLFSQDSNAHLGTYSAHPLIFDTNSISRIKIGTATGSNNAEIKVSTNDSSTDYLKWGANPRLWLRCPDGINGLRIDSNTTPLDIRSSDANGRSISIGGSPNFDMSISGDYSLSSNGHDSSPKVFLNATRHNGSGTVTSFQTSIQAVSLSNTSGDGYLGLGASASPDDINILTNGKVFIGPYSAGDDFSDAGSFLNLKNDSYGGRIAFSSNAGGVGATLMEQFAYWGNNKVAGIIATGGGSNSSKNDGELKFYTRQAGQGAGERVRITRHGATCFGVHDNANNALDTLSGFAGTRNVNILSFPTSVSPWSSWVGTNLYHDGSNFVKHSDHLGQNWGNIAGIKFDGANHGAAIGMRFIVDLPQGNAGGNISLGSAVSAVDNKSAMNIYATGQVTKPKHCSFNYGGNGDLSVSNGDTLASWRNNGTQCYELGTKGDGNSYLDSGVFTAPVTGSYFFTSTILLKDVTNSTDSVHVYWQKNGSGAYHYFNTRFHGETGQGTGMGYGGYVPVIGACTMYMSAGDTCRIKIAYSGSGIDQYAPQNDGWTNWSGFLIG